MLIMHVLRAIGSIIAAQNEKGLIKLSLLGALLKKVRVKFGTLIC
jgi:hypothetical protein